MTVTSAYDNNPEIKAALIEQVRAHTAADKITSADYVAALDAIEAEGRVKIIRSRQSDVSVALA